MKQETAKVKVKNEAGDVVASREYQKVIFLVKGADAEKSFAECVQYFQTTEPKSNPLALILEHVTYSFDLEQRAAIRAQLVAQIEGPDKAIETAAKKLMVAVPGMTLEVAKALVLKARADAGA